MDKNLITLGWFVMMLMISILMVSKYWFSTYNHYVVRKKQTHGQDYEREMIRLWRPFIGIILLAIFLCSLPFYADKIFN